MSAAQIGEELLYKNNTTSIEESFNSSNHQNQWLLYLFFSISIGGCVLNLTHVLALVRCRRNGILSIILQISLIDAISLYVSTTELLALEEDSWSFASELCPFFKGTEVFVNSLIIYLITCFNFQIVSLWNLHEISVRKNKNRNPLTSCNVNSRNDSNECLVTKQENATRSLTIDYRRHKNDVSVVFPAIFVWFVCLSLSIPNFTLSTTLKMKNNKTLCAVIDIYYNQILQNSLLVFKTVIPTILLIFSLAILIAKTLQVSKKQHNELIDKNSLEFRRFLVFGVLLSLVYLVTSLLRHVFSFLHVVEFSFSKNTAESFKMPPLYNSRLSRESLVVLGVVYYLGACLRAVLCVGVLPRFRGLVREKVCVCCGGGIKDDD